MPAKMTYSGYLDLDAVLGAQRPLSGAHDELLFIVIHQASELWLKLSIHELEEARERIRADDLRPAFKIMSRVARVLEGLGRSWGVLGTMTPSDYQQVRPYLGSSSGFQSPQYRLLEFMLGARKATMVRLYEDEPAAKEKLVAELARPSLYHEVLRLLARRGLRVPETLLNRPGGDAYESSSAVEACWREVYADPVRWWDLYELAEKLVDLESCIQHWRFGHLKTVERVIGFKRGTGGTPGAHYLAGVLNQPFFPELLSVRTAL
jgi:tryptophan 2,3-dioxygenase